jgi:rhodanese-related sulfurtransferase
LTLREVSAARLAEVERAAREYLGEAVEVIGRDELVQGLARGDVALVDVRPEEEYAAGHIDGARSIPIDELERRIAELPLDREIVAYCRGPFSSTPTKLYASYAQPGVRRGGWKTVGLSGDWDSRARERSSAESPKPTLSCWCCGTSLRSPPLGWPAEARDG